MTAGPARTEPSRAASHPDVVLVTLLGAGLVISLVQTFVAPALPAIAAEYDASASSVAWVLTAFLLSSSVSTPLAGKLGDLYGRSRVLVAILLVFTVGSVVAGLATSFEVVVLGRAIQGLGGGVFPLAYGVLRQVLPPVRVAGAIGLFSAMFGIGGGVGLVLSGVLIDTFGVPALFWVGVLALPAAVVVRRYVADQPRRPGLRLDWWGAAILSASLLALLLGLSQADRLGWGSPVVLMLLVGGAVGLAGWVVVEQRVPQPMVELRLLRSRPVLMANLAGLAVGFAMFAFFLLVPQYLQTDGSSGYGFALTVTGAGLVMLPCAVVQLGLAPFAGVLARRVSSRFPLLLGTAAIVVAHVLLVITRSSTGAFLAASAVLGVGLAFSMASMANVVVESVPAHDVGVATAINQIARTVGGALGTQVVTAVLAVSVVGAVPSDHAYGIALLVAGLAGLAALAAGLAIPRRLGEVELRTSVRRG